MGLVTKKVEAQKKPNTKYKSQCHSRKKPREICLEFMTYLRNQ